MLNSKNERELAYVVRVDDIKPIEGPRPCRVRCSWRLDYYGTQGTVSSRQLRYLLRD